MSSSQRAERPHLERRSASAKISGAEHPARQIQAGDLVYILERSWPYRTQARAFAVHDRQGLSRTAARCGTPVREAVPTAPRTRVCRCGSA
jgi:hypothetical protein